MDSERRRRLLEGVEKAIKEASPNQVRRFAKARSLPVSERPPWELSPEQRATLERLIGDSRPAIAAIEKDIGAFAQWGDMTTRARAVKSKRAVLRRALEELDKQVRRLQEKTEETRSALRDAAAGWPHMDIEIAGSGIEDALADLQRGKDDVLAAIRLLFPHTQLPHANRLDVVLEASVNLAARVLGSLQRHNLTIHGRDLDALLGWCLEQAGFPEPVDRPRFMRKARRLAKGSAQRGN